MYLLFFSYENVKNRNVIGGRNIRMFLRLFMMLFLRREVRVLFVMCVLILFLSQLKNQFIILLKGVEMLKVNLKMVYIRLMKIGILRYLWVRILFSMLLKVILFFFFMMVCLVIFFIRLQCLFVSVSLMFLYFLWSFFEMFISFFRILFFNLFFLIIFFGFVIVFEEFYGELFWVIIFYQFVVLFDDFYDVFDIGFKVWVFDGVWFFF